MLPNVESSDCKDNLCLSSSSSSTSINVFAQHPYTITTAMLSIAVNAHVSIEIKPFDFFCSSHSFSFQLLLSRLFQCSNSSIVIVVVLSYLWFASFFQKHFMNPWRQLFRFFLQDVFFFHHAFCIKIIWNFLLQAMCSHKVSISSNGWMEIKHTNNSNTRVKTWKRQWTNLNVACVLARFACGMCKWNKKVNKTKQPQCMSFWAKNVRPDNEKFSLVFVSVEFSLLFPLSLFG